MDILNSNEILIEKFDYSQVQNGTIEVDTVSTDGLGGNLTVEKWVFGGGDGCTPQTWRNNFYNQLLISPWACFYISHITALSNTYNIVIPMDNIITGWNRLVTDGKFFPGKWGYQEDGAKYAVKIFNEFTWKSVRYKMLPFTEENRVAALKSGSCYTFGIHYWPEYMKNEQDDWQIQNISGTVGTGGHLVCGIKENNIDDDLGKYAETYHGVAGNTHEIILVNFKLYPKLFMNNLIYFIG